MTLGQRFARFVTDAVVRSPVLWRVFRGPLTRNFDRLAPNWDTTRVSASGSPRWSPRWSAPRPRRHASSTSAPERERSRASSPRGWPDAEIVGVDLSAGMIAEARRLAATERYSVADASALPFPDGSFDLVTLVNMIPFFDELARVTGPAAGRDRLQQGAGTPIYVPVPTVPSSPGARLFAGCALLGRRRHRAPCPQAGGVRWACRDVRDAVAPVRTSLFARLHFATPGRGSSVGRAHG